MSCLQVDFHFKRLKALIVLQVYIPSTLVVVASWITFWLECSATTARTQLGILTVLTMTTQRTSAGFTLPKVSYVISIDIWYFMCLSFVFASVIEFAFINVLTRKGQRKVKCQQYKNSYRQIELDSQEDQQKTCVQKFCSATYIDKLSRVVFPVLFAACLVVYWCLVVE